MHINYNNSNLTIRYLQYFLKDNYTDTMRLSGEYDEYTHQKLIEYLDIPNSVNSHEITELLNNIEFDDNTPLNNLLKYPFRLMQSHLENDTVVFHYKNPKSIEGFVLNETEPQIEYRIYKKLIPVLSKVYNEVNDIVESNGWRIVEYPDLYNEISEITEDIEIVDLTSITIIIKPIIDNIFPNYDVRYMVNYFNNDYIDNFDITGDNSFNKDSNYRIGLLKCKPNDRFIIAHNYTYSIPIKVAYSTLKINELKEIIYTSNINRIIEKIKINTITNKLIPGIPLSVKVANDEEYQTLLVILPNLKINEKDNISDRNVLAYNDTKKLLGDISNKGIVDEIDRLIYYCHFNTSEEYQFYFDMSYDRLHELVDCIENRYSNLFLIDNVGKKYNHSNFENNNIDNIIEHLKLLCSGSDIKFTRYIVNNEISYTIKSNGNVSKEHLEQLDENNCNVSKFDLYLSNGSYSEIFEKNISMKVLCNYNMPTNNLLVIKSNPENESIPFNCSDIINGEENNKNTVSLPILDFVEYPWQIRDEFVAMLLDTVTNKYSNAEDISFVYKMLDLVSDVNYIYTDELKATIKEYQINDNHTFSFGYFTNDTYAKIYEDKYNEYLMRG